MIHAKAEHKRQAWPRSQKKRKRTKLDVLVQHVSTFLLVSEM